jgi:pimeloyl-ACP methyl ester carboxylesterase
MMSDIPYDDFGGHGPLLHFAHANAYPPGVYRALLEALAVRHHVVASHQRSLWPASQPAEISDWQTIAGDLICFLDQQDMRGAIGVGHSLGAVTTMMASLKRPELFRVLILIEPVFLPQNVLDLFVAGAALDQPNDMPLVRIARNRRSWWPDQKDAFAHFRAKQVFGRWSDEALWDYVRYGTVDAGDGGIRLAYPPEWEARIYATPPTGIWELIPEIQAPTLALRGRASDTLNNSSWSRWRELQPQATFEEIGGAGHLLPMELPAEVAVRIEAFLALL